MKREREKGSWEEGALFGDRWREMKDRLSKANGVGAATGILKGQRMRTIFYEQNKYGFA